MHTSLASKSDLHVHSKHSDRPSEWFLRRIGSPESFADPSEIYRNAQQRGMDFVTISDHNCIRGALEIGHLKGTFLSSEITTYFPEDGCKIHILVLGINESQFRMIQELRADIYQLQRYLADEDVIASVAHPLYRVNGRLTIDHVEKLLLMFHRFEEINGMRDRRASDLIRAVFRNLTPDLIARMADRHGIDPAGSEPWRKCFTGGSDDHSGVHVGTAHTATPYAKDANEFLSHLRRGEHEAAGGCGGSVMMGHSVYHIAYCYYKDRFVRGNGKPTILGELFKKLLEQSTEPPKPAGLGSRIRGLATGIVWGRRMQGASELERTLVKDISALFSTADSRDAASPLLDERRTFHYACQISHSLGYSFVGRFLELIRQGRFLESLHTVAAVGPVALSMAPYLAAFSAQHKDEGFLNAVAAHFAPSVACPRGARRKAWITDTFAEVNGVSRTIQAVAAVAKRLRRPLTVLTSLDNVPATTADVKNFTPVGTFPMPEYESQPIAFPPFLEVIEYIERHRFTELTISTPGPMGLTGLAAARLLGLRTTGIYHTDFVQYVRYLTQDDDLADLTWKYMAWFYEQAHTILVPTEYYRQYLIQNGFDSAKLRVMTRGVDSQAFHPGKRDPSFFGRYGLDAPMKFLYVGRVSREKDLDHLIEAFDRLRERGHEASLVVVGDGPYRRELQARCQGRSIVFTGELEGDDLAKAYASADAMVFPSTTDTFGNVVLEAQASGVPVIVSDVGGPAEIVRTHASGIIVDHHDPKALTDAMEKLCRSPELRADLRARGLCNASECTWEKVLETLWNPEDEEPTNADVGSFRSPSSRVAPGVIALELA